MKKIKVIIVSACTLMGAAGINAQTLYDANRLMGNDLNGTARYVGMGGAMGALGGDISTMGSNPAGIGIYRSNDIMTTFGFAQNSSTSLYRGNESTSNKNNGSFDNVGFVYSNKIGNKTALKYVNFGFNYHKQKSFNKAMAMQGDLVNDGLGFSQTDQMANQSQDLIPQDMEGLAAWNDHRVGWLSILGWQGYLTQYDQGKKKYSGFPGNDPYGNYSSRESGGVHAYDFNLSFNVQDRVYFGFTLGAYSVDYTRESYYREGFLNDFGKEVSSYSLENWFKTSGSGIDFKAGVIVRPFESSPLRIGASIHTPTLYNLTDKTSALLLSDIDLNNDGQITGSNNPDLNEQFTIDTYKDAGDGITEYQLITPWKYNLSLGYTIGSNIALGAEYEYTNYTTASLRDFEGTPMDNENNDMKTSLKGVHTFRVGAEIKLVPQFAVRLGYNHSTASMSNDAFKFIPYEGPNSIRTDTEFANTKAVNNYTIGMGYRGSVFYADIAYQLHTYKEDFYAFEEVKLAATKVTNSRNQLLLTLGVRF